jgi:hypothetical protein
VCLPPACCPPLRACHCWWACRCQRTPSGRRSRPPSLLHGMVSLTALRLGRSSADVDSQVDAILVCGLAALTGLRDLGLLHLSRLGVLALEMSDLGRIPFHSLHVDATSFGFFTVGDPLMYTVAPGRHLTRLVVAASAVDYVPALGELISVDLLWRMGELRVLELTNIQVPHGIFDMLAGQGSLCSLSLQGCDAWSDTADPGDADDESVLPVLYGGLSRLTQLSSLRVTQNPGGGDDPWVRSGASRA